MAKQTLHPPAEIAFIGLGAMGIPMVKNLIKGAYKLKVFSRTISKETKVLLKGAKFSESPQDSSLKVNALLICVNDDSAVEDVIFGNKGAISNISKGCIVINLSTITPNKSREINSKLKERSISYLDAPVTGGTEAAINGTLTILASGNEYVFKECLPILRNIGNNIHFYGEIGKGQEVKAVNQILVAGCYASLAEGIAMGTKLGLPMNKVVNSLKDGAAFSWALKNRSSNMINDSYYPGFKLKHHNKDLKIALEIASDLGIDLPITKAIKEIEEELIKQGYENNDLSVLKKGIK